MPERFGNQRRMRPAVLVFAPVRDAAVDTAAHRALKARRRPPPPVGTCGRTLVEVIRDPLEWPPLDAELKRPQDKRRARGVRDQPLVTILLVPYGTSGAMCTPRATA
jgi:hypothetical protein